MVLYIKDEGCAQLVFVFFLLLIFKSHGSGVNSKKAKNRKKTEYCTPL
jgi:hypothetical protein